MNNTSNNTVPRFAIERDMKNLYRLLYQRFPKGFPEFFVFKNLSDLQGAPTIGRRITSDGRSIYFVNDSTDDEILSLLEDDIANPKCCIIDSLPITYHPFTDKEVSQRLLYACDIADSLDIELKQICFTYGESESGYSEEFVTFIGDEGILDSLVTIAHELRHAWQHKHHPEWDTNYIHPEDNVKEYYNQISEIDAEAYGIKAASMITGIELVNTNSVNLHDTAYRARIIKRMQEIDVVLSSKKIKNIRKLIELDDVLYESMGL